MITILSALFFAISSSSDNLVVGLSYGLNKIKINVKSNIIIALISGLGTFISMFFGKLLLKIISPNISNILGSSILIFFGIYMLYSALTPKNNHKKIPNKNIDYDYENILENPEILDIDKSKNIETSEALLLGLILCLNNIGLGIGASITGLNIYLTSLASLLFSLIFIQLGFFIGKRISSKRLEKSSNIFSALIIILLGLYELL